MRGLGPRVSWSGWAAAACLTISLVQPLAATTGRSQPLKGDRELGAYLASECVTCHQVSGRFDGIPPIVGWPEEAFVAIMNEYRSHRRENVVMRTIAERLSPEEIAALAAYFSGLPGQGAKN